MLLNDISFVKISQRVSKFLADTISKLIFSKSYNSIKDVELWFLFSAHRLMELYITTKNMKIPQRVSIL